MRWSARGIALVPEGRRLFPSLTRRGKSADRRPAQAGQGRGISRASTSCFPVLAERRHLPSTVAVRRPAADGRDRPRADVESEACCCATRSASAWRPIVVRDIYARMPAIVAEGMSLIIVEQDIVQALKAAQPCLLPAGGPRRAAGRGTHADARGDLGGVFRGVNADGMAQHHPARRADRRALRHVRGRAVADLRRDAAGQHRARRPDRARGLSRAGDDQTLGIDPLRARCSSSCR